MKRNILTICLLISFVFPFTVLASDEQVEEGRLSNKTIVMVVPERLFHESTFDWLKEIFIREGAEVVMAASNPTGTYGLGGVNVKPDILVKNISVEDLDALVFVGGAGCLEFLSDYMTHELAKRVVEQKKILAAIHLAPRILAEAGLLKGRKVACTTAAESYLKEKGAIVTGNDVERDGYIITAIGPSTAKELGEAIVSALSE